MSSHFNAGPPDPINFLRTVSEHDVRYTSDNEADSNQSNGHGRANGAPPLSPTRNQEAPARERPPPGQAWPYRENLSFTRSLIFYGAGAVTMEHVKACKNIEACRAFRKKIFRRREFHRPKKRYSSKPLATIAISMQTTLCMNLAKTESWKFSTPRTPKKQTI